MKYKLINRASGEQHLCDKVTIDGFDYYVSDQKIHFGYVWNTILEQIETMFKEKTFHDDLKGVIATTNPNIDIPKVVDEVEILAYENCQYWEHFGTAQGGFIKGYNKSQKTHPFSKDDVKEIFKIAQMQKNYGDYKPYTFEEAIQLFWKEQQPKTVYYV